MQLHAVKLTVSHATESLAPYALAAWLAASLLFSCIAYEAGLSRVTDQNYVYGGILAIILASVIVSRFGSQLVMRHIIKKDD